MLIKDEAWLTFQRRCDRARRLGKVPWNQEFKLRFVGAPQHGPGFVAFFPIDSKGQRVRPLGPSVCGRLTICG